jgi:hypothetical protein
VPFFTLDKERFRMDSSATSILGRDIAKDELVTLDEQGIVLVWQVG